MGRQGQLAEITFLQDDNEQVKVKSKRCRYCNEEKSSDRFYNATKSKDGLHSYCIPCSKIYQERHRVKGLNKKIRKLEAELADKYNFWRRHLDAVFLIIGFFIGAVVNRFL